MKGEDRLFKTLLRRGSQSPSEQIAPDRTYAYKASLIGAAHQFELTENGLLCRTGRRSSLWAYADIAAIRLSYRPMGMQHRRFRADIDHVDGRHITIFSTSKQTAALMEPQAGYRGFMLQLHRQLAAAGGEVKLRAGLRPGIYGLIIAALAFVGIAMAVLFLRAVFTGEFAGVVFIVGFTVLFGWQISGFLRRNKPRNYIFESVPKDLLP